ncbi:hypothetical protein Y032_0079g1268 [Ancylostoma ceylanicum]|uniref:Uncharacterized protein n=1 Tax=Ancylostoma ceylanicum TaxID=53326 RepID=A0A016TSC6_9BILA|nr:hypothetical protein Y032_0079g1268 [Ancylostoma ceylanicum]
MWCFSLERLHGNIFPTKKLLHFREPNLSLDEADVSSEISDERLTSADVVDLSQYLDESRLLGIMTEIVD